VGAAMSVEGATDAAAFETYIRALPGTGAEGRTSSGNGQSHYTPKHASWLNQVEIELSVVHKRNVWEGGAYRTSRCSGARLGHGSASATTEERRLRGALLRRMRARSSSVSIQQDHSGGALDRIDEILAQPAHAPWQRI
jgi:hypothetical protein